MKGRKVGQVKEHDWVVMRLLFLLMGSDVSNVFIRDVAKTIDYLRQDRGIDIEECFGILNKEHAEKETLTNNPNSAMIRKFDEQRDSIEENLNPPDANQQEERRYFGNARFIIKLAEAYKKQGKTDE